MTKLTKEQAAIIGLYTSIVCGPFADIHELAEKLYGGPIWTHQFPALSDKLKELVKPLFLELCYEEKK